MLSALFLVLLAIAGSYSQERLDLAAKPLPIFRPCPAFLYDAEYNFNTGYTKESDYVKVKAPFTGKGCSTQGVLEIALASAKEDSGRRRVLVDLFFSNPQGWTFNLGDSATNNGYAGDGATQSHDAEVQGNGNSLNGYLSDYGNSAHVISAPNLYSTRLTLLAGDGHLVWLPNNNNLFNYYFSPHLYALNGQSDAEGPTNYNLYLGINRVIQGSYRSGSGLCRVGIKFLPEF